MCKIANSFWINTWNDYCELRELFNDGARLASGLMFSHEINDGDETYYCFRPTDRRVDGAIYVTDYRLCDVFDLLNASVEYKKRIASAIRNVNCYMIGVVMDKYIDLEDTLIDVLGYKVLYDNISRYFGIEKMQKALESVAIDYDLLNDEDEDED